jgi:MYXO-CTERM domain-containing protein
VHRRRRQLALAGVAALALLAPAAAGAHARIEPETALPGAFQLYTMTVPTERDVPTVEVALKVPAGIETISVETTPGWKAVIVRKGGKPDVVRWTGGSIPPDFFGVFRFIARNPVAEGELVWPVTQRYQGGEVVSWTGPADSETPAPRVEISEPGGGQAGATETAAETAGETETTAAPTTAASDDGGDTVPIVLSIAALVLAAAALALAVRRRSA